MNTLINLPPGFFECEDLNPAFARLEAKGEVRKTSHNTPDEIRDDLAWADAVMMWSWPVLDDDLLAAAPNLKYRGHLDLNQEGAKIAVAHDTPVSLSKHAWSPAVAEMGLTLILTTLRKVSDFHARMREGNEPWIKNIPADIDPLERELTGRPVGIIGLGGIGRRLAELLQPFHCELLVSDPYVPEDVIQQYNGRRVELKELIANSDVVALCAASNEGTRKLIGPEEIALFRENAVLVNICRAALVDTEALIQRLKQGDLFAALDVFDNEPLAADHPLRRLPNAYLTPHRAGGIMASIQRTIGWLIDDMENALEGKPLKYPLKESMIAAMDG